MAHLQPVNVSRPESDLYSYNDRSYNSWQYADEASLYSIAEDSREDRASEIPSMAGTENTYAASHHLRVGGAEIEVQWPTITNELNIVHSADSRSEEEAEPQYMYNGFTRRRCLVFACAGVLLVAIISALTVAGVVHDRSRNDNTGDHNTGTPDSPPIAPTFPQIPMPGPTAPPATQPPSSAPVESEASLPVSAPPVSVAEPATMSPLFTDSPTILPTQAPTFVPTTLEPSSPAPTTSPTHSPAFRLADGLLFNTLRSCANPVIFEDPTTIPGRVYEELVLEIVGRTTTAPNGFINFPLHLGVDYLKEKFALEVLYLTTNGNSWIRNNMWMADSDPCDGWSGIHSCRMRREGSCAVLHVNLTRNNLIGELPEELCCFPCLQTLSLDGNRLSGPIPHCFGRMTANITMDNNFFDPTDPALVVASKLP